MKGIEKSFKYEVNKMEFENKKNMVLDFTKQAIKRKEDVNIDLLMEKMPMGMLEKYLKEGKEDLILENVIYSSPHLHTLLRNLHLLDWRE